MFLTNKEDRTDLTDKSYIIVKRDAIKCPKEKFENFWSLIPKEKESCLMYGKRIPIPRFQKLYATNKDISYSFYWNEINGRNRHTRSCSRMY